MEGIIKKFSFATLASEVLFSIAATKQKLCQMIFWDTFLLVHHQATSWVVSWKKLISCQIFLGVLNYQFFIVIEQKFQLMFSITTEDSPCFLDSFVKQLMKTGLGLSISFAFFNLLLLLLSISNRNNSFQGSMITLSDSFLSLFV